MARSLGSALPPVLLERFGPTAAPPPAGRAVLLVTLDAAGLPHPSLLADAEVLAPRPNAVRLAVQPASRTAANLREPGVATLALVEPEGVHYVKLRVRDAWDSAGFACFEAEVADVLEDVPHGGEGQVALTSGLRWTVADEAAYVARAAQARQALSRQA
jgi:hypothetical protein